MANIRPFCKDDINPVVSLYRQVFLEGRNIIESTLCEYFSELYFESPWVDSDIPALVYEAEGGKIVGFVGVIPRRMRFQGKDIRAAFGSNLMVHPDFRGNMAGLQLMRAFLSGPQDLSLSDTANHISHRIWEIMGGSTSYLFSLRWVRLYKPSLQYYLNKFLYVGDLRENMGRNKFAESKSRIRDYLASRLSRSPVLPRDYPYYEETMDVGTLDECIKSVSADQSLQPKYDVDSLQWLLSFIERNHGKGELQKILLHDRNCNIVGWYLYLLDRGYTSQVFKMGARKGDERLVLEHLINHAWRKGASALIGQVEPRFLDAYTDRNCLIERRRLWFQMHSADKEIINSIHSGDASLSRLDGEWFLGVPRNIWAQGAHPRPSGSAQLAYNFKHLFQKSVHRR